MGTVSAPQILKSCLGPSNWGLLSTNPRHPRKKVIRGGCCRVGVHNKPKPLPDQRVIMPKSTCAACKGEPKRGLSSGNTETRVGPTRPQGTKKGYMSPAGTRALEGGQHGMGRDRKVVFLTSSQYSVLQKVGDMTSLISVPIRKRTDLQECS